MINMRFLRAIYSAATRWRSEEDKAILEGNMKENHKRGKNAHGSDEALNEPVQAHVRIIQGTPTGNFSGYRRNVKNTVM
ncbi:hypothetical protein Hypma_004089 [Hypsizygus marmoreus]|uniref:Uncharacterized protein n=1 Tax=Hypsizygus marmoreus TaxID=39966 RepID=A0A369K1R5_HYPMA|nr:hypothetical protein Hypma_004089 [Hypsizygus marmoreus]